MQKKFKYDDFAKYRSKTLGGGGSVHINSSLVAQQQKFLIELVKNIDMASIIPHGILKQIIPDLRLLIYAADWKLQVISTILRRVGLSFYSSTLKQLIIIRKLHLNSISIFSD